MLSDLWECSNWVFIINLWRICSLPPSLLSFLLSFILSFIKYLLSVYYVSGLILRSGDTVVNKTNYNTSLHFWSRHFSSGASKQANMIVSSSNPCHGENEIEVAEPLQCCLICMGDQGKPHWAKVWRTLRIQQKDLGMGLLRRGKDRGQAPKWVRRGQCAGAADDRPQVGLTRRERKLSWVCRTSWTTVEASGL